MSRFLRTLVAAFDTGAMGAFAYATSGLPSGGRADLVLWGSAAAAALVALVIAIDAPAFAGWAALGYVLFAGLLAAEPPHLLLVALAVALAPVLQRPRGSLALGIVIATVSAFAIRFALPFLA